MAAVGRRGSPGKESRRRAREGARDPPGRLVGEAATARQRSASRPPPGAGDDRLTGASHGAPQPVTFDSLLRATSAMSVARNVHDVSEILESRDHSRARRDRLPDRRVPGTGKARETHAGSARPVRAAPADPPESAPTDAFAEKALQRRRLVWVCRGGLIRLVIPLLSRNEPWGYVDVQAHRSNPPGEQEAAYLQALANSAATALEIACLRRNVGSQAMTDSVTGFYSGWHFHRAAALGDGARTPLRPAPVGHSSSKSTTSTSSSRIEARRREPTCSER